MVKSGLEGRMPHGLGARATFIWWNDKVEQRARGTLNDAIMLPAMIAQVARAATVILTILAGSG